MGEQLLEELKKISQKEMEKDKFYHDYAHVLGVYNNVEKLLKHEKGDRLVLLTTALFHDICRDEEPHDKLGAEKTTKFLKQLDDFPKEKIEEVANLIRKHEEGQTSQNEKVFADADKMEAFSMLGFARGLMMFADWDYTLKDSITTYRELLEKWYEGFHFDISRELVRDDYESLKVEITNLEERYSF